MTICSDEFHATAFFQLFLYLGQFTEKTVDSRCYKISFYLMKARVLCKTNQDTCPYLHILAKHDIISSMIETSRCSIS